MASNSRTRGRRRSRKNRAERVFENYLKMRSLAYGKLADSFDKERKRREALGLPQLVLLAGAESISSTV